MKGVFKLGIIVFTVVLLAVSLVSASYIVERNSDSDRPSYNSKTTAREEVFERNYRTYRNYHPPSRDTAYHTLYWRGYDHGYVDGFHDGYRYDRYARGEYKYTYSNIRHYRNSRYSLNDYYRTHPYYYRD